MASDRLSRRRLLAGAGRLVGGLLVLEPTGVAAQEGVFMQPEDAPRALFPHASAVADRTIAATAELRARIRALLTRPPSLWEAEYRIFTVAGGERGPGFVVIVEEIGKHRPISFAVAVDSGGHVSDIVVLAHREAYGGEVRERRFLKQYAGKTLSDWECLGRPE